MSMPGMGAISASSILAEIGDYNNFDSPNKLAAYFGIVPSVYQSAGKQINGHITKHGSPHIRRMLVEVAHAIARTKSNSKLKTHIPQFTPLHNTFCTHYLIIPEWLSGDRLDV